MIVNDGKNEMLISDSKRECLHVLLGDKKTTVAEAVMIAQRVPIHFLREKLCWVGELYDVVVVDTPPSAGELQTQA